MTKSRAKLYLLCWKYLRKYRTTTRSTKRATLHGRLPFHRFHVHRKPRSGYTAHVRRLAKERWAEGVTRREYLVLGAAEVLTARSVAASAWDAPWRRSERCGLGRRRRAHGERHAALPFTHVTVTLTRSWHRTTPAATRHLSAPTLSL